MERSLLQDGTASFEISVLERKQPSRVVLFAVGGGGNPERHAPLLTALAERGCSVVAPHFDRFVSPSPSADDLLLRARRLRLALDSIARPGVPIVGVGHSIGATVLLALAGGQVWMRAGEPLPIAADDRLERLALMAPATGFFQAPGALDAVRIPLLVRAGTNDTITPPAQAEFLERALGQRVPVDLQTIEGAGHFSFMNAPPPHTTEPLPDRDAFLARLTEEIGEFLEGRS
jgi:pimeloyl-ACP methyl ester carboxylesterase